MLHRTTNWLESKFKPFKLPHPIKYQKNDTQLEISDKKCIQWNGILKIDWNYNLDPLLSPLMGVILKKKNKKLDSALKKTDWWSKFFFLD